MYIFNDLKLEIYIIKRGGRFEIFYFVLICENILLLLYI